MGDELPTPDWAPEVDTTALRAAVAQVADDATADRLDSVAAELRSVIARLDVERTVAAVDGDSPRAVLDRMPGGPLLVLRWSPAGEVSTVHHHAWTVFQPIVGGTVFERWNAGPAGPGLNSTQLVGTGGTIQIGDGELHRQVTGPDGSVEVVVIGDYTDAHPRMDVHADPAEVARADALATSLHRDQRPERESIEGPAATT